MRKVLPAALVLASMVIAGASARRTDPPAIGETLRIATYNIHKGADRRNDYNLERTIEAIYRLHADVVGVQEAMRNDPAFGCDDQPAMIARGLERRTGRRWTHVYAKAWITTNRECERSGRGDEEATEGLAFFTHDRIVESDSVRLNEGRVGLSVRLASFPRLPLVVTHLAANRVNQPDRVREIGLLLPWTARRGPGILVGDLNTGPDTEELVPVMARYRDGWADAAARGSAAGILNGATRPNRTARIDYVLFEPAAGMMLEAVDVVDTDLFEMGEVSDHFPVVATFRRARPAGVTTRTGS
jgi:endonuclease/exonuclease/phosphatase family metal-dependent hydrolase